ncbi:MAG TPA: hypothetical protein VMV22_02190 [Acidimicrobiales bacterium]|nr:hypothetical protein [Acidimicrobiales bacterium]
MHKLPVWMLVVGLLVSGCASSPVGGGNGGPTSAGGSSTVPVTSTSAPAPSALDDLTPFVTAAARLDRAVAAAADLVNGGIGTTVLHADRATVAAVEALDPATVAATIPVGLSPALLRAVLLVDSDLVSRTASLHGFTRVFTGDQDTFPVPQPGQPETEMTMALACLRNGATAAARFSTDLAAVRALASAAPPVVTAAPASRSAEELAALLDYVGLANTGCASCGGTRLTELPAIRWETGPGAVVGSIGGIAFEARYTAATGWTVLLHAC